MRFAFIDANKACYPILVLCRVLHVRRSGFYAWRARPACPRRRHDAALSTQVRAAFQRSRGTYGSPRIHAELRASGLRTSKRRVQRLMKAQGLSARRKRYFRCTTDSRHSRPIAANLLQRCFTASAPDRVWTTDITCIWTLQGWLYLAVMLDLYSRRVVGWALGPHPDEALALSALKMALRRRKPAPGLIHHSDRGSTYCGRQYLATLAAHGIVRSMSRKADCLDNAVSESIFGTLKEELVYRLPLTTAEQTRTAVFEYLEAFYNPKRRHSTLGYLSPVDFEEKRLADTSA